MTEDTTPEHPAVRAARAVKEYHAETILKIDSGFIFMRDGTDCNEELRSACEEHIIECDKIIELAFKDDPAIHIAAEEILKEMQGITDERKKEERTPA